VRIFRLVRGRSKDLRLASVECHHKSTGANLVTHTL
jgi:hypothetical protein